MLNFQQAIKLFSNLENQLSRVWLNSGTLQASEITALNSCYCQDAFIPKDDWRKPTTTESNILWTTQPPSIGDGVALIRIPEDILALFKELEIDSITNREHIKNLMNHKYYNQATSKVIEYISQFCPDKNKIIVGGIAGHEIGLSTVTTDKKRNNYHIGLHLDSWQKLPLNQRHHSSNRISINLGRDARYLLFINLPLMKMFNSLNITAPKEIKRHQKAVFIREEFFNLYPNYPVVKLKIKPGEAYIAPTENMIHDGCTTNKDYFDLSLVFRGYFKIF